eukprot:1031494-Rhodomonas_salina.1
MHVGPHRVVGVPKRKATIGTRQRAHVHGHGQLSGTADVHRRCDDGHDRGCFVGLSDHNASTAARISEVHEQILCRLHSREVRRRDLDQIGRHRERGQAVVEVGHGEACRGDRTPSRAARCCTARWAALGGRRVSKGQERVARPGRCGRRHGAAETKGSRRLIHADHHQGHRRIFEKDLRCGAGNRQRRIRESDGQLRGSRHRHLHLPRPEAVLALHARHPGARGPDKGKGTVDIDRRHAVESCVRDSDLRNAFLHAPALRAEDVDAHGPPRLLRAGLERQRLRHHLSLVRKGEADAQLGRRLHWREVLQHHPDLAAGVQQRRRWRNPGDPRRAGREEAERGGRRHCEAKRQHMQDWGEQLRL